MTRSRSPGAARTEAGRHTCAALVFASRHSSTRTNYYTTILHYYCFTATTVVVPATPALRSYSRRDIRARYCTTGPLHYYCTTTILVLYYTYHTTTIILSYHYVRVYSRLHSHHRLASCMICTRSAHRSIHTSIPPICTSLFTPLFTDSSLPCCMNSTPPPLLK